MDLSSNASLSSTSEWWDDQDSSTAFAVNDERELSRKYQIRLYAVNLPVQKGVFRDKPYDSFAVVSSSPTPEDCTHEITQPHPSLERNTSTTSNRSSTSMCDTMWGKTEVVKQSRNPQWTRTMTVEYKPGSDKYFYVIVFQSFHEHTEHLGTALFHVSDLLSTKNCTRGKRLRDGGCVFCRLELVGDSANLHRMVFLQFQATNLILPGNKHETWNRRRRPDTILEIAQWESSSGNWLIVYRSPPVLGSYQPRYEPIQIDLESLCGGDLRRHLRLQVLLVCAQPSRRGSGSLQRCRKPIGMTETTLYTVLHRCSQDSSNVSCNENCTNDSKNQITMGLAESPGFQNYTECGEEDCENSRTTQENSNNRNNNNNNNNSCIEEARFQLRLQRNSEKQKDVGRLGVLKAVVRSNNDGTHVDLDLNHSSNSSTIDEVVDLLKVASLSNPSTSSIVAKPLRSFSEYILDGCQIEFCVAIDFTSSNGDPRHEGSYHFQGKHTLNDYEETISAIGRCLGKYSSSQEVAVYGFGAKYDGQIRHIFQCGSSPTVVGVEGILQAYRSVFDSDLVMSGPTVFIQVIQAAAARAKRNHESIQVQPIYTVLLVITDGSIAPTDFSVTRERLNVYSTMPLSIVFVGVGRSDFSLMHSLCSPSPNLAAKSIRCNTTFVEFCSHQQEPASLGEAALRNIPLQLCEYMSMQGI